MSQRRSETREFDFFQTKIQFEIQIGVDRPSWLSHKKKWVTKTWILLGFGNIRAGFWTFPMKYQFSRVSLLWTFDGRQSNLWDQISPNLLLTRTKSKGKKVETLRLISPRELFNLKPGKGARREFRKREERERVPKMPLLSREKKWDPSSRTYTTYTVKEGQFSSLTPNGFFAF